MLRLRRHMSFLRVVARDFFAADTPFRHAVAAFSLCCSLLFIAACHFAILRAFHIRPIIFATHAASLIIVADADFAIRRHAELFFDYAFASLMPPLIFFAADAMMPLLRDSFASALRFHLISPPRFYNAMALRVRSCARQRGRRAQARMRTRMMRYAARSPSAAFADAAR